MRRLPCLLLMLLVTTPAVAERLDLGGGDPVELVRVPMGPFRQGSPSSERGRVADELLHTVTIAHDFFISEVPITRGQFARFVAASNYRTEAERGTSGGYGLSQHGLVQRKDFNWHNPGFAQTDQHPVVLVTYADAAEFAHWASGVTGKKVRLPTEAEWEMSCRAGTDTPYYGAVDDMTARTLGWFKEGAGDGTRPVRSKRANGLGLYDLIGHVQTWTSDVYAPYAGVEEVDPVATTPPTGEPLRRVLRGGSFLTKTSAGRCAARARATPGSRNADIGLRVVVDVPALAPTPPPPPPTAPTLPTATHKVKSDVPLVLIATGFVGGVFLLWLLVGARKSYRAAKASQIDLRQVRLQGAADGFRIFAPPEAAGQLLRYRYTRDGKEGTVKLEPSPAGQFVYTGGPPSGLAALGLVAAAVVASSASASASSSVDSSVPDPPTFTGGSSGYPPAY